MNCLLSIILLWVLFCALSSACRHHHHKHYHPHNHHFNSHHHHHHKHNYHKPNHSHQYNWFGAPGFWYPPHHGHGQTWQHYKSHDQHTSETGFVATQCIQANYYDNEKRHECDRPCRKGDRRICYYRFVLEAYEAHNPQACSRDCQRSQSCHKCIKTDGIRTPMLVTNFRTPLKELVVCKGDIVQVDVVNHMLNITHEITEKDLERNFQQNLKAFKVRDSSWHGHVLTNSFLHKPHLHRRLWLKKCHKQQLENNPDADFLPGEPTTIHWHGLLQKHQQCADGVPYVTQPPIKPGMIYRYKFLADHAGTSFAHSHFGLQRGLGLAGPMIIRESDDPSASEYDKDLSEHVIFVTDFGYQRSSRSDTILIGGHGVSKKGNDINTWKGDPKLFHVQKGHKYRFRCVFNGIANTPIVIKIEGHKLKVIAVDGNSVKPRLFDSVVLNNAERIDFVVNTNYNEIKNYLIHVSAFNKPSLYQVAILRYKGAAEYVSYDEMKKPLKTSVNSLQLNTLNVGPNTQGSVALSELKSVKPSKTCIRNHKCEQIFVEMTVSKRGFQINNITMDLPAKPLLMQLYENGRLDESKFCNADTLKGRNCVDKVCSCMHLVKLKMKRCYEIVLMGAHPFHLHGYVYYVVGRGIAPRGKVMSKELFLEMDRKGQVKRNLYDPPGKDTIATPRNGYTLVRICTDNPGVWMSHCHIELHTIVGMSMVFMVGEADDILKYKCKNHNATPYANNKCFT